MDKIVEGNFLTAQFMGYDYPDTGNMSFKASITDLHNYHEDWNLLMPVVEKINKTTLGDERFDVIIWKNDCHINNNEQIIFETNRHRSDQTLISIVWLAVTQFINRYNSINNKNTM